MINVDGVANGHFRDNCLGQNLNRYYKNPSLTEQPEIYYIDQLLKGYYQANNKIELYLDLHGHLNSGGIFIYGNYFKDIKVIYIS